MTDIDLTKPSLAALSHVLRHKELWPVNFEWNFRNIDTCAYELADRYWNLDFEYKNCSEISSIFNVPYEARFDLLDEDSEEEVNFIHDIFFGRYFECKLHMSFDDVTPEMVADAIDNKVWVKQD